MATTASSAVTFQSTESKQEPDKVAEEGSENAAKEVFKGLGNQGATCYMNSLLQALYMTPDFRSMIYKWRYDPNLNAAKKDCIIYQMQKLFA